jgi:broad specificity phosphatase PhoE
VTSDRVTLYLIRHGETEWSLSGRHTGSTDIPLTARGESAARQLAPYLDKITFPRIMSSPRSRAYRTCELAGLGTPEIDVDLSEWDYGAYEGKRTAEILSERPGWDLWKDGCPGGEMPEDVARRADRVIAFMRTLRGNVALFSHGHFGCALAARWAGLEIVEGRHFALDPASISTLGYVPRHPDTPAILLWNARVPLLCGTS